MPIVRELINRVSFKVNPGDKANAEKAFLSIKNAASKVLKGIGLITAAGAKMFTEAESNRASVKFFSRTNEEAEKLLQIVKEIQGEGIISERERLQAAAILSELIPEAEQLKDSLSILKDISIAQPKLDFPQTVQLFAEFVKTGDIDSLRQLGAVGKDLAEQLSIANIDIEQSVKGQVNRAELLTQELEKQKLRIRELANEQKNTLLFGVRQLATEASNFTLKFGEETSSAIGDVVKEITAMLNALNKSEGFWKTVRSTVEISRSSLKALKNTFNEIEEFFSPKEIDKREKERVEGFKKRKKEFIRVIQENAEISSFPIPKGSASQDAIKAEFNKRLINNLLPLNVPGEEIGESRAQGVRGRSLLSRFRESLPDDPGIKFTIDGKIIVEGRNLQGANIDQLGPEIQAEIVKEAHRNIIAKSGGETGIGGQP